MMPTTALHFGQLNNQQLQGMSRQHISVYGTTTATATPPLPVANQAPPQRTSMREHQMRQYQTLPPFEIQKGSAVEIFILKSTASHHARFWRPAIVHLCEMELVGRSWLSTRNMPAFISLTSSGTIL